MRKTLARMPSFVSERSETTENLRSVYLGARASLMSLPRMSEDTNDAESRLANNMMTSPSMSVLSESSFLSVYGSRNDPRGPSSPPNEPSSTDGPAEAKSNGADQTPIRTSPSKTALLNRSRRSTSVTRN